MGQGEYVSRIGPKLDKRIDFKIAGGIDGTIYFD